VIGLISKRQLNVFCVEQHLDLMAGVPAAVEVAQAGGFEDAVELVHSAREIKKAGGGAQCPNAVGVASL